MPETAADRRRRALRDRLIVIAEARIAADGLQALRARDLATEAGCAVGAIYNVFGDLDDLVLAVNARSFRKLGAAVAGARGADSAADLVVMAQAYHHFAAQHFHLWRALFDLDRAPATAAPAWYLAEMEGLLDLIDHPLAALFPALSASDHRLMTRALFSAVHGIVYLGLDRASAGVPVAEIDRMLALVLDRITGAQAS